jgi:alkanesulfonate monooxygenase SsuD/methylene tetrahydromethanopterin reductase-like flavin-dependent oxidoreductase (luciferase family)
MAGVACQGTKRAAARTRVRLDRYRRDMRHAVFLPIFGELAEPGRVAALAAEAEEAGWDGMYVWDHIAYSAPVTDIADPWITLAAMACRTERLRIGSLVTPLPRRRPMQVAREVATLDRLSQGRVTLGVGIGDDGARELSGTGEQTDAKMRGAMLDEALEVLTAAWSGDLVRHRGEHYVLDGLRVLPRPVQRARPPIWVAMRYGNSAPLRRAARYDGVFPIGVDSPNMLREVVTAIEQLRGTSGAQASETGGDPESNREEAFDVVVTREPGQDWRPYADAGATWSLVSFSPYDITEAAVRAVIDRGAG